MITQHVVAYDGDITLTRLPAGRAEGYVWLSFVARGIPVTHEPDDMWRLLDHVALVWLDGSAPDIPEVGSSGDMVLTRFDLAVRDAGYNTLTIRYVDGDRLISSENVALPVL